MLVDLNELQQFKPFRLSDNFLDKYKNIKAPFGFNGLGELVYMRTYSRIKDDGNNEQWWETVRRVVEGTYNMQKKWIDIFELEWNAHKAQYSAQEMYDRMFNMKFLPPGRGLWAMGSQITEEKGIYAALNNCGFVSTATIKDDLSKPFCFLMDMSMLGVGVGFDTRGNGEILIKGVNFDRPKVDFTIPDTREGWVESVRMLIDAHFLAGNPINFNYSEVRPAGLPIKGFGGISSGPDPLIELHENINKVMLKNIDRKIDPTIIVDLMNHIGKAVVAGNVRRTAEIAFGEPHDEEYLDLKNWKVNPHREDYGWTSNNSIFAELGMDYSNAADRTKNNGEPGYVWLDNIRGFSRMRNGMDNKDHRASGTNPCVEQSLESYELCCLVETFPYRHTDIEDFKRTLKFAYLYAKTVTLGRTHWAETNRVLLRNRRIGCSVSGIAQFLTYRGHEELRQWLIEGYDTIQAWDKSYSEWLCMPRSIKTTSVKPSGTVSLLVGSTPGVHYPESRFYIRRITVAKNSPMIKSLKNAGLHIEDKIGDPSSMIVEVPVDIGIGIRTVREVSMWEQLSLAAFMQRYWADNQVSATITFDKETEGDQIAYALNFFQYQLKGVSFLPREEDKLKCKDCGLEFDRGHIPVTNCKHLNTVIVTPYPQMPYETIDEATYNKKVKYLKPIDFSGIAHNEAVVDKFCNSDVCELKLEVEDGNN